MGGERELSKTCRDEVERENLEAGPRCNMLVGERVEMGTCCRGEHSDFGVGLGICVDLG